MPSSIGTGPIPAQHSLGPRGARARLAAGPDDLDPVSALDTSSARSEPFRARLPEGVAHARRRTPTRRQHLEDVVARADDATGRDESGEGRFLLTERGEDRDGPPVLGHFQPLATLYASKVFAQVLPKIPHSDPTLVHVAHRSTSQRPHSSRDGVYGSCPRLPGRRTPAA
jgi:hypothetical protein